ncbi:MAG: methylenetetrahydromethanopterin dehydrogenase, partial [Methylococcaceae bacterium]|nr:methylenetetrahydromethanopterin dehydrogenase [Methylococcaceae bacterium]
TASSCPNAVGIGALAVGNIKYKLQHYLLRLMLGTETPVYLDFRDAFVRARELV